MSPNTKVCTTVKIHLLKIELYIYHSHLTDNQWYTKYKGHGITGLLQGCSKSDLWLHVTCNESEHGTEERSD